MSSNYIYGLWKWEKSGIRHPDDLSYHALVRILLAKKLLSSNFVVHNFCSFRVNINDKNIRSEPKFVVFISHLLLLFKFCSSCLAPDPLTETRQVGTMVEVKTSCSNIKWLKKRMFGGVNRFFRNKNPCRKHLVQLCCPCCRWISQEIIPNIWTYGLSMYITQYLLQTPTCKYV